MSSADLLYGALPMTLIGVGLIGFMYRLFTRPIPLDSRPEAAAGVWATMPTRWGLGAVMAVHALVLFLPSWVLGWNSSPARLYIFEGAVLAVTLWALLGVFAHLVHFAGDPDRPAVNAADMVVVGAVLVFLVTGALTSLVDRWATSWSAAVAAPYARSMVGADPRPELMGSLPILARVHTLAALGAVAALPFSRFAIWLAAPARSVHRLISELVRPRGRIGWGGAWVRAGAVFAYFVVFTVIVPSQLLDRIGGLPDLARDAVTGGVWAVFLIGGLAMLRWAQRTSRI